MRKSFVIHRLVTANSGTHDFTDLIGVGVWCASNGAAAGTTMHYRLSVVASLEGVYPSPSTPPAAPATAGEKMPPLGSVTATVTQHPWGTAGFPSP